MHTRREFIRQFGISLLALLAARCTGAARHDNTPRGRLRNSWLDLDELAAQAQSGKKDYGQQALADATAAHRQILDELVTAGELSPEVADHVQAAFDGAAYHVWRSNAPITCYEPVLIDYRPSSSGQLAQQAALLAELAGSGEVDAVAVAQAHAAIERDITFLNLSSAEVNVLYAQIQAQSAQAGIPDFDQVPLDITPEAAEAARFLVDLLLGE